MCALATAIAIIKPFVQICAGGGNPINCGLTTLRDDNNGYKADL